ncbi:MAG: hypothetical protein KC516_00820 [Nanoarchaeota archaeon]|nr:hypothetical protein [Nanoarchaeota archaeon]
MNKKGQVTLFIIIAIIIVVLGVLFFIFKDSINFSSQKLRVSDVELKVSECLKDNSEYVLWGVGQGGGYFYPINDSTEFGITYYYLNNENLMPSLEEVEKEISNIISEKVYYCVNNFTNFTNYDEIEARYPSAKTTINDEKTYLELRFPIKVVKGEEVIYLEEFPYELRIPLGKMYSVAEYMISIEKEKQGICITCNAEAALNRDLTIEMIDGENQTVIFILKDENYLLEDKEFEWVFANDYSKGL